MKKAIFISLFLLLFTGTASAARERAYGFCTIGQQVSVVGIPITPNVQTNYPGCQVKVFLSGTNTLANLFSDNNGTPLANPFTANLTFGYWFFYADDGRYDVQISGAGMAQPFTYGDVLLNTSSGGGGGGTSVGPQFTVQVSNGAGGFGAGGATDNGSLFTIPEDLLAAGPNPYTDVRRYGVRAVTAVPSTTASVTSGLTSATLAAASTFQNGDGIVITGAGPAVTMTTPGAPTVTPVLTKGSLSTGEDVASLAGATTYNYQIVARDKQGGLTAASPVGTTTTGLAALGTLTATVTGVTRSGNTVTVTLSTPTDLVASAAFYITGTGDQSFNGFYTVTSRIDSTHFTYTSSVTTVNGATTSASAGGTVTWWASNRLTWTAVAGAWQYEIYGRSGGALTFLGTSRPNELVFDDYGTTIMGTPYQPPYVPTTPPVSTLNDPLVTTIVSGAGTVNLVLANAASNTVAGAAAVFDNGVNLATAAAAANGSPVYIPSAAFNSFYFVNSFTDLSTAGKLFIQQDGALAFNETVVLPAAVNWLGNTGGSGTFSTSFNWITARQVSCNAMPCVYINNAGTHRIEGVGFIDPNDQALDVLDAGGFQSNFKYCIFGTGNGTNLFDPLGIGVEVLGGTQYIFEKNLFTSRMQNNGPIGLWAPSLYNRGDLALVNPAGRILIRDVMFVPKGVTQDITLQASSNEGEMKNIYAQGIRTPFITFSQNSNGPLPSTWTIDGVTNDTSFAPVVANLANGALSSLRMSNIPSFTSAIDVTGNPGFLLWTNNVPNVGPNSGVITETNFSDSAVQVIGSGSIGFQMPPLAAPTVVVGANGSCVSSCVAAGTYSYQVLAIDQAGKETPVSAATSGTTNGTQTITVSWTLTPGQVATRRFRNGVSDTVPGTGIGGTSYVDASTIFYANSGLSPGADISSISQFGLSGPQFIVIGSNGLKSTMAAGTFSANRNVSVPDVSGVIPITSYLNSAYDNFNRANGGLGAKWTSLNGTLSITGNVVQGNQGNQPAVSTLNITSTLPPDEFCEVVIASLNGGTDFPGCAVRVQSAFSWYGIFEITTGWVIQRRTGQFSNITLTSGASTGAPGDVLRLEIQGNTLTAYQNGVVMGTVTDNNLTAAGTCGIYIQGTVATVDNASCGALHPIAQLDIEQDWTQPQHFQNGITIGNSTNPALTRYTKFSSSLTPAAVAANTCAEQTFTVTGIQSADIAMNGDPKPTHQAGLSETWIVTATNTVGINFCNNTGSPITPTAAETYKFVVVQ